MSSNYLEIAFVTENPEKYVIAETLCKKFNVKVHQETFDIDEIQGEDPVKIIKDKVIKAYEIVKKPVVVSDDSWEFVALKGFPGPYMKSMNNWFEPNDFISLMKDKKDRTVYFHQYLAFFDGSSLEIFSNKIKGQIIDEPKGLNPRSPNMTVTVFDIDDGKTNAEVFEMGSAAVSQRYLDHPDAWHKFLNWYTNKN